VALSIINDTGRVSIGGDDLEGATMVDDRTLIEEALYRYAYLLDTGQNEHVAEEIFADDAVMDYGTGPIEGRAAIHAFYTGFTEEVAQTAHCYTNVMIQITGDVAKSHAHVTGWHWTARPDRKLTDPADITIVGGAKDEWRKTARGWRITNRIALQFGVAMGSPSPGIAELMAGMKQRASWP